MFVHASLNNLGTVITKAECVIVGVTARWQRRVFMALPICCFFLNATERVFEVISTRKWEEVPFPPRLMASAVTHHRTSKMERVINFPLSRIIVGAGPIEAIDGLFMVTHPSSGSPKHFGYLMKYSVVFVPRKIGCFIRRSIS